MECQNHAGYNYNSNDNYCFNMKNSCRIGTWNVRTMLDTTKLDQVLNEMDLFKLDLLGLCETRWPGQGDKLNKNGSSILFSGKGEHEDRLNGVAIIISKNARKSLLEWKPISDRILTVRIKSSVRPITIIQCYAPTEVSEEEPKDVFYQELSSTLQKVKKGDIIILMGDLNAKVGSNNEEYENIMGQHGLGQRNSNGERLIELCMEHDLIIGGTQFPHKDIHKVTWTSPDQQTQNQIDHIAISKKWRGCLNDVRNKRSADVGSDHHLLIGKIKLKLSAVKRKAQFRKRKRYNVVTLHNETNAKK
ncbi:Endonuclease-reverse transcriptase [Popillia japonica]|uniref:Endonuclease-reverse transcriptase n=1 Tax=Popillia japonica TaxID=7064 RepID=A0AAW1JW99_POPJA